MASPSAPQQKIWLVDSGATNHITSDISNLQEAVPYSSSETVTYSGGEGLLITNIGNTCILHHNITFILNLCCMCRCFHNTCVQCIKYVEMTNVNVLLINFPFVYMTRSHGKSATKD